MPKTPDEIKKGLECCAASYADCHKECPYKPDCDGSQILKDALALIRWHEEKNEAMHAEIVRLQAERDAAVNALRLVQEKHEKAAEVIDDEVFPLVDYDVYLRLRDAVDDMMSWEDESDSCGVQKEG